MSTLEAEFREVLNAAVPGLRLLVTESDPPVLEIPAVHPEIGPIVIELHPGEITVYVGRLTHSHFDPRIFENVSAADALRDNMKAVASWIAAVLSDRVILWSSGAAGGSYPTDSPQLMRVPKAARRFVWSGPVTG